MEPDEAEGDRDSTPTPDVAGIHRWNTKQGVSLSVTSPARWRTEAGYGRSRPVPESNLDSDLRAHRQLTATHPPARTGRADAQDLMPSLSRLLGNRLERRATRG